MPDVIMSFQGAYDFLSNFYEEADGKTAEHRFQAGKARTEHDAQWIMNANSPGEAKRRGRRVKMRSDWDTYRHQVMYRVLVEKFSDPKLRALLLATNDIELVEGNTWHDTYWGVDLMTGQGQNWLGHTLMQIRKEIRDEILP